MYTEKKNRIMCNRMLLLGFHLQRLTGKLFAFTVTYLPLNIPYYTRLHNERSIEYIEFLFPIEYRTPVTTFYVTTYV